MNIIKLIKTMFDEVKDNEIKQVRCRGILMKKYYVSDSGIVFSINNKESIPIKLKPYKLPRGYYLVCIHGPVQITTCIHRIVYETFVGPIPPDKEINHIDANKANNSIYNLEVITHQENIDHARRNGLLKQREGEDNPNAKYTDEQAKFVYDLLKEKNFTWQQIATLVGVPLSFVRCIASGWRSSVTKFNPSEIRIRKRWKTEDSIVLWFLYYIEGTSKQKIAKVFNVSKSSVAAKLRNLVKHKDELDKAMLDKSVQEKIKKFLNKKSKKMMMVN